MKRRTLLTGAAGLLCAPAIAQPAKGAVLRFVPQANLTLLDPIVTTATVTSNHGYYVFDTLYSGGPDGVARPQMVAGHEISDDKRTWRLTLREGLRFHDGSPVLPADCIASIERWASRDPFGTLLAAAVESWGADGDRVIVVKLKRPFALLPDALGKTDSSVPFIMPARLAKTVGTKAITEMVGSGPYKFVAAEYVSGSRVVYEKFEQYVPRSEPSVWATGGKHAYFPRVVWSIIPDGATAAAALQNGEVDWWEQPLPDLLPLLVQDKSITVQKDQPWGRMSELIMNQLHPPFDDVRVRRAVMMGVRQEDYMRATFGDDTSLWRVTKDLFPADTPYYSGQDAALMGGDQARAAEMLKQSGYDGRKVVVLNPTDFAQIHPLGLVTADMLRKIGMNVDLQETDWGTVVQRRASMEPVAKGGWNVFHTFSSAISFASPATHHLLTGRGRKDWFGWWSNDQAIGLVDRWANAADAAGQTEAARALSHLAMTDVAEAIVGQWYGKTAFRKSITGVQQGVAPYPWNVRPA